MPDSHIASRVNSVIDKQPDGVVVVDKSGQVVSVDLVAQKILGYESDTLVNQSVLDLVPPAFHRHYGQIFRQLLLNGTISDEKHFVNLQRQDGVCLPVELSIHILKINQNTFYLGNICDLSHVQTERDENIYIEYVETVMDVVLDGLITIDAKGHIQSFNRAAERIFGYSAAEVIGKNVSVLMPKPYAQKHDYYLAKYQKTGERSVIGSVREIEATRKDGTTFPMELGVSQLKTLRGLMFVGTIRDISERKAAEKKIESYIRQLKSSNEELDQFAYIASHDLKEPIRGLANNALFLLEDFAQVLGEDGTKRLDRIRFLCSRMEGLVDSLLYYSRLGRQDLAIDDLDLNEMVEDIKHLTISADPNNQVEVIIPHLLPVLRCDAPRTTELFRNLMSNAVKYNHSEVKTIEIGVTQKRNPFTEKMEEQVFYVKDNGIGIDPIFFDDVFRIFKRLNEEDDVIRGTGVGLTFVKKIVERHKGHIWIESNVNDGTCFYFTLNMMRGAND